MIKVLLVNDDPHELTRLEFQIAGLSTAYSVNVLTDPVEAMIRLRKETFDMIFVDYRMSVIDGLSLVRVVNKISPDMYINILANSADAIYIKSQATYKSCDNLLSKPCDIHDLQHIFEQFLRYHSLSEENKVMSERLAVLEGHSSSVLNHSAS